MAPGLYRLVVPKTGGVLDTVVWSQMMTCYMGYGGLDFVDGWTATFTDCYERDDAYCLEFDLEASAGSGGSVTLDPVTLGLIIEGLVYLGVAALVYFTATRIEAITNKVASSPSLWIPALGFGALLLVLAFAFGKRELKGSGI